MPIRYTGVEIVSRFTAGPAREDTVIAAKPNTGHTQKCERRETQWNGMHACLLFLEVLLKHAPHLRPRTVEEHPLIDLGNAEEGTGFLRTPSFDVTQSDDLTLIGRQRFDCSINARTSFL